LVRPGRCSPCQHRHRRPDEAAAQPGAPRIAALTRRPPSALGSACSRPTSGMLIASQGAGTS
jgi:hypothetical protein